MSTSQPIPVRGRFAPSPLGAHAPWQPLLRASCVAFRAQPKRRDAPAHRRPRPRPLHTRKSRAFNGRSNMARPHLGRRPRHERTHAPYCQSARRELYESALSELRAKTDVYPCFCTRAGAARGLRAPCGRWHVPLPRFMPKFDARRSRRKKPHAPPKHAFSRTRGHRYI